MAKDFYTIGQRLKELISEEPVARFDNYLCALLSAEGHSISSEELSIVRRTLGIPGRKERRQQYAKQAVTIKGNSKSATPARRYEVHEEAVKVL